MPAPSASRLRRAFVATALLTSIVAVVQSGPSPALAALPGITVDALEVAPGPTAGNPSMPMVHDGQAYWAGNDHVLCDAGGVGIELYRIGLGGSAELVEDYGSGCTTDGVDDTFDVEQAAGVPSGLVFRGQESRTSGWELHLLPDDGGPIERIRNLDPGLDENPRELTSVLGGTHVAYAGESAFGYEPSITDGTSDGTSQIADLEPGSGDSDPRSFTPVSATRFVSVAAPGDGDEQLFGSTGDGAEALGVVEAGDTIEHLTHFPSRDRAVFFADDGVSGSEPWVTDGTPAGTVRLADVAPGSAGSNPRSEDENLYNELREAPVFVPVGDVMFFRASSPATGTRLWVTDGTPAGTRLVDDVNPVGWGAAFGDQLWFAGPNSTIWRSDGTSDGTVDTGITASLTLSSGPSDLTPVGDVLFFRSGLVLYATDGTAAGTAVVRDDLTYAPRHLSPVGPDSMVMISRTDAAGLELFLVTLGGVPGDTTPPPVPAMTIEPDPVEQFHPTTVTVSATDAGTGGSDIAEIVHRVDGGEWLPMDAIDGGYDSPSETASVDLTFEDSGPHEVCARAIDAEGNGSASTCQEVEVAPVGAVPLALTISSVRLLDPSAVEGRIFASAYVQGIEDVTYPDAVDADAGDPFWTIGGLVSGAPRMPVTFGLFVDQGLGPQQLDADPAGDSLDIVLEVDRLTGRWSGDVAWPQSCAQGTGELGVEVCFAVSVWSTDGDLDGDGLLDGWERDGLEADGDDVIDLPLPEWGARMDHKDLFWEIDHMPGRAYRSWDVEPIIQAFRAAPLDAGGIENPDGRPGIELHLDVVLEDADDLVGGYDPTRYEASDPLDSCRDGINNDGAFEPAAYGGADDTDVECGWHFAATGPGSYTNSQGLGRESTNLPWPCEDGIDDDGDGLIDEDDPDCHVLESSQFGGAEEVGDREISGIRDDAYTEVRNESFDLRRRWVFRYLVSASDFDGNDIGGQASIRGTIGIVYNRGAGTFMHEMGHNLGLRHGGSENTNRKPNHLSVMNYNLQGGIPLAGDWAGSRMLDYAPPRYPAPIGADQRGSAVLPTLDESDLRSGTVLDPDDPHHRTVFWSHDCLDQLPIQVGVDQPIDWDVVDDGVDEDPLVNTYLNAKAEVVEGLCVLDRVDLLEGHDDWSAIVLSPHAIDGGDLGDGEIPDETGLRREEADEERRAINSTELRLDVTASPDRPVAGEPVHLDLRVENTGPNPADVAMVRFVPPDGATFIAGDCAPDETDLATISCPTGSLLPGEGVTLRATLEFEAGEVALPVVVENLLGDLTGSVDRPTARFSVSDRSTAGGPGAPAPAGPTRRSAATPPSPAAVPIVRQPDFTG